MGGLKEKSGTLRSGDSEEMCGFLRRWQDLRYGATEEEWGPVRSEGSKEERWLRRSGSSGGEYRAQRRWAGSLRRLEGL